MTGAALPDRDIADAPSSGGPWADELAFAIDVAREAGNVLMDHYERLERIDYKTARDVVTEADHLSEELVIAAIRRRFPRDEILAEESGAQQLAVSAAQHELDLALQRYQGGAVGYLEVVTAQSMALTNERTAIEIARRRLDSSVLLVKALGGLWG